MSNLAAARARSMSLWLPPAHKHHQFHIYDFEPCFQSEFVSPLEKITVLSNSKQMNQLYYTARHTPTHSKQKTGSYSSFAFPARLRKTVRGPGAADQVNSRGEAVPAAACHSLS